jgi:hypothetical protein
MQEERPNAGRARNAAAVVAERTVKAATFRRIDE